jgi:hypothetical protein
MVSLLSWRACVTLQNGFDERLRRFYSWLTACVDLSLSRNRVPQRFPYHAPVHPKLPGYSFDRSFPVFVFPPNLFESFHFGSPVQSGLLTGPQARNEIHAISFFPQGANLDDRWGANLEYRNQLLPNLSRADRTASSALEKLASASSPPSGDAVSGSLLANSSNATQFFFISSSS